MHAIVTGLSSDPYIVFDRNLFFTVVDITIGRHYMLATRYLDTIVSTCLNCGQYPHGSFAHDPYN